jgi:PAS domain S-box-containing protein
LHHVQPSQKPLYDAVAILESITDGFFSVNKEWEFTYVNHQAEKLLAMPREKLVGENIWESYPGLVGTEFEIAYRKAATEKATSTVTSFFAEHDRWYEVHAYPSEIGISVYFRDATERVRGNERLRESELQFRLMTDAIPQIVWITDADGRGIFFNQQWADYTGISIDSMKAEEVSQSFLHPDDDAHTIAAWNEARQEGTVFSVEHRIRAASGEYRWFLVRAVPHRDPDTGKIARWYGTSTDVHDRKTAEASLRQSEERYRSLFDSIDQGFCIIEMIFDQDGNPRDYRFCEINPVFEQQTGLHEAEGKTMRELIPEHEQYWFDIYGKVAVTGESIRFESESRVLGRWFDLFAFRIEESGGAKVAVLFRDITEQKRVGQLLRTSEQQALEAARQTERERRRLEALLQAVPVGIVVSDFDGAILLSNAAHRHLWGQQHPDARSIDSFREWKGWWADGSSRHGRQLEPHEWPTARILLEGETQRDIIEIESFDTPPVRHIVLVSGAPIRDGDGRIAGAVIAQMDITERIKAEEALRQADRRKDEFLAMLAHELRNPLAPISAAADLLGLIPMGEAEIKQTSGIIARQVHHLTGLVDDLLDVSRVTRGLVSLEKTRLDAKRVVSDAVEQVRPLIESRRHRLTVDTPPESAFVVGDSKRLVQVMTNLLNNAAKYTPEGGHIALSMEVDGDHVKITVTDNGIGMTPELVTHAFELFMQAKRTSDRSQGGLGIGLALVKSLVELHGGSIHAYSDGMGKGSRFTVCLPHLAERTDILRTEPATAFGVVQGPALTVMVVDDNVDAARMLAMLIEALGHHVIVEHHPRRALERAKAAMPDVCLLDIGLPDMDGNELARCLRAQPQSAQATLIAISGYGQEHERAESLRAGFSHHFAKPVNMEKLAALLADIGKI